MSWLEHHTQSEQYASLAEIAKREEESGRTALLQQGCVQELYRFAADCEVRALEALDITKTRTLGITVSQRRFLMV